MDLPARHPHWHGYAAVAGHNTVPFAPSNITPVIAAELVSLELRKVKKPSRADDRAFYMNLMMNGLTNEGYEFTAMTSDKIVMKRTVTK